MTLPANIGFTLPHIACYWPNIDHVSNVNSFLIWYCHLKLLPTNQTSPNVRIVFNQSEISVLLKV